MTDDQSLSWLGTGTSIKSDEVKLVLDPKTCLLSANSFHIVVMCHPSYITGEILQQLFKTIFNHYV